MAYLDEEAQLSDSQVIAFSNVTDFNEAVKDIIWRLYTNHQDEFYKGLFFLAGILKKYVEKILTRILGPNPYA
jgi:hypothetical protein